MQNRIQNSSYFGKSEKSRKEIMNVTEFLRPSVANDISEMNNCMNK